MSLSKHLNSILQESNEVSLDEQMIENKAVLSLLDRLYAKLSEEKYSAYSQGYKDGQEALKANIIAMLRFYE